MMIGQITNYQPVVPRLAERAEKVQIFGFWGDFGDFFWRLGRFFGVDLGGGSFWPGKKIDRQRAFLRAGGGVFCKNRGFPLFFVCEGVNFLHIV